MKFTFFPKPMSVSLGALGAIALIGWGAFHALLPEKKQLTPERRTAVREVTAKILTNCPRPKEGMPRLVIAPLAGDYTGEVTAQVREILDGEGFYNVARPSIWARMRDRLRMEPAGVADPASALAFGESAGSEWVLWGHVRQLSQQGSQVAVDLELSLNDVRSKAAVWSDQMHWERPGVEVAARTVGSWMFGRGPTALVLRLVVCGLFFILFPLLMSPAIRAALNRESNALTLSVLASLTVVDVLAALVIFYGFFGPFFYVALVILLALAAGWYNYWTCDRLEKDR